MLVYPVDSVSSGRSIPGSTSDNESAPGVTRIIANTRSEIGTGCGSARRRRMLGALPDCDRHADGPMFQRANRRGLRCPNHVMFPQTAPYTWPPGGGNHPSDSRIGTRSMPMACALALRRAAFPGRKRRK